MTTSMPPGAARSCEVSVFACPELSLPEPNAKPNAANASRRYARPLPISITIRATRRFGSLP